MKNIRKIASSLQSGFYFIKEKKITTEIFLIASCSAFVNISNFVFFAILSRFISIDLLGSLNAQIGTLIVIAYIFSLGIPARIMHLSNQERVHNKVIYKKIHELLWALIYSCLIAAVIYYSINKIQATGDMDFPFLLLFLILIFPISDSFSGYLYGKKKAALSSIFSIIDPLFRIIFLLIFLTCIKNENINLKDIYNIYIFSGFISISFLIYFLSAIVKPSYPIDFFKRPKVYIKSYTESIHFGMPAFTRTLAHWSPLMIISWITSPQVAGIYFIYSRFVMLISALPQKIIDAILVPMIYEENKGFINILNKYRNLMGIILFSALVFIIPALFSFLDKTVFPNYQEILSFKLPIYIVSSSVLIKLFNFIIEYKYISRNKLQLLTKIKLNSLVVSMSFVFLITIINQNTLIISNSLTAALCIIIFELISILFSSSSLNKLN